MIGDFTPLEKAQMYEEGMKHVRERLLLLAQLDEVRSTPHTHTLMRSWKRGQAYVSVRCVTCSFRDREPAPQEVSNA